MEPTPDSPYRPISRQEGELLARLISFLPPTQQEALSKQSATCRVRTVGEYDDNYGSIEFEVPGDDVGHRMLVNAIASDEDGVPISILLFVSPGGRLAELEVVRLDGLPLRRMPAALDFMPDSSLRSE